MKCRKKTSRNIKKVTADDSEDGGNVIVCYREQLLENSDWIAGKCRINKKCHHKAKLQEREKKIIALITNTLMINDREALIFEVILNFNTVLFNDFKSFLSLIYYDIFTVSRWVV